jgi:hypothetical protein
MTRWVFLSKSAAREQKIWASRVLRMVRLGKMAEDHPDAVRATAVIGTNLAMKIIRDDQKPTSDRAEAMPFFGDYPALSRAIVVGTERQIRTPPSLRLPRRYDRFHLASRVGLTPDANLR